MTSSDRPASYQASDLMRTGDYWTRSMRPLHVLAFLLPLLVAYEIGSVLYLSDARADGGVVQRTIEARRVMDDLFGLMGIAGYVLPGIALASVLVVWHVMSRDRWILDFKTLGGMLAESIAWTMPLLVMSAAVEHARAAAAGGPELHAAMAAGDGLYKLPLGARLTLAVGAGLYEEMLFRLIGLALLHFILADLIALPRKWASVGAVALSAVAFAVYHKPVLPDEWSKAMFYVLSGAYFGTVYVLRGFGIVVGTHAVYDVLVLAVLSG